MALTWVMCQRPRARESVQIKEEGTFFWTEDKKYFCPLKSILVKPHRHGEGSHEMKIHFILSGKYKISLLSPRPIFLTVHLGPSFAKCLEIYLFYN